MLLLIAITFFYLTLIRIRFLIRKSRQGKIRARWATTFTAARKRAKYRVPHIGSSDRKYLLELWIEQRAHCSADDAARLDKLAFNARLDKSIETILGPSLFGLLPRQVWQQDLALTAAQWIDTPSIRKLVMRMTNNRIEYLAVKACACLVALKAKGYQRAVIKTLFRFPDESSHFATQLSKMGGAEILKTLEPFLSKLPTYTVTNFLSLAEQSSDITLLPLLVKRLKVCTNYAEAAALLRSIGRLGGSEQRSSILPYLNHSNVFLKIQALKAIGKIGVQQDVALVTPFLSHPEWWVRYRSALAIIELINHERGVIDSLKESLDDVYAKDILTHAWAETEWHMT